MRDVRDEIETGPAYANFLAGGGGTERGRRRSLMRTFKLISIIFSPSNCQSPRVPGHRGAARVRIWTGEKQ